MKGGRIFPGWHISVLAGTRRNGLLRLAASELFTHPEGPLSRKIAEFSIPLVIRVA